jgi:hypothetical protein
VDAAGRAGAPGAAGRTRGRKPTRPGERPAALPQRQGQLFGVADEEAAGLLAQGQVDERGELAAGVEHLPDDAHHRPPRAGVGPLQVGQHFALAGVEALVAALQALQHLDPAHQPAALHPQVGRQPGRLLAQPVEPVALAAQGGLGLARGGQLRLERVLGGGQLLQFDVQRGEVLGGLLALLAQAGAVAGQAVQLGLVAEGVVV